MPPEMLEGIFVQREPLVQNIIERVRESATTRSKHYMLLIGPRGIGKTNLVTIVNHRLTQQTDIGDKIIIAWLREEEYGIGSILDFFVRILRTLAETDPLLLPRIETLYQITPTEAEDAAKNILKEYVGDKTLVLLMENLDDIFQGLGDIGQRALRSFIQENPFWTIIATSQSLFAGVSLRKFPFYGFFTIDHLQEFSTEDVVALLTKIAETDNNIELKDFINTPNGRARIRALRHIAGGNPRIYVILSSFLTKEKLDELAGSFIHMLDELTPYYQHKMKWLSPQQRKIIEYLCDAGAPATVKEIAQRCFITPQTASKQLSELKIINYVHATKPGAFGRETYYELHEPLMRLCIELKKNRGEPIRLLVDFLRLYYSHQQLSERYKSLSEDNKIERAYIERALKQIDLEHDPRIEACIEDQRRYIREKRFDYAFQTASEIAALKEEIKDINIPDISSDIISLIFNAIVNYPGDYNKFFKMIADNYEDALIKIESIENIIKNPSNIIFLLKGMLYILLKRYEDAVVTYDKVLEIDPMDKYAWGSRGIVLSHLQRYEDVIISYDKVLEIDLDDIDAWHGRGNALFYLQRYEEAITSYDKILQIHPEDKDVWFYKAHALDNLKRYEEEIISYDKIIEIDPNHKEAWYNRGSVLDDLQRYEEAIISYDKAIDIDHEYKEAWYNRGAALYNLQRHEEAIISYNKIIHIDPHFSSAISSSIEAYFALNQWDKAYETLHHLFASQMEPDETFYPESIKHLILSSHIPGLEERLRKLTSILAEHNHLSELGTVITESVKIIQENSIPKDALTNWVTIWQELAREHKELEVPVELMSVAVQYLDSDNKDGAKVLLKLPAEKRKVLEDLLEIESVMDAN